jgi:hypothetical protein
MKKEAWVLCFENKYYDGLDEKWSKTVTEASLFPKKSKATKFISMNFSKTGEISAKKVNINL